MRYLFNELASDGSPVIEEISDEDIIRAYYPFWKYRMEKKGLVPTKEACIADWVMVNWAWPIEENDGNNG